MKRPWYRRSGFLQPLMLAIGVLLGYVVYDVGPLRDQVKASQAKLEQSLIVRAELLAMQQEESGKRLDSFRRENDLLKDNWPRGEIVLRPIPEGQIGLGGGEWRTTILQPGFALCQIGMDPVRPGADEYPIFGYFGVQNVPGQAPALACLIPVGERRTVRLLPQQREELLKGAGLRR